MKRKNAISAVLAVAMLTAAILPGCSSGGDSGVTEIEILQYKPEAATYFDQVEEQPRLRFFSTSPRPPRILTRWKNSSMHLTTTFT